MNKLVQGCLELVRPQFCLDLRHGIHGVPHWARVWRNARELAEAAGVDPKVPCLFSFLHDSRRYDDGPDKQHGRRAATWVEQLFVNRQLPIGMNDFHLLCVAIDGHSDGETEAHPVVQVCWDADRLDLGRVGIRPDPRRLCTAHARKTSTIDAAVNRSIGAPRSNKNFPIWMC